MEPEDVSEKIEWEAARVAAAFGVSEWKHPVSDKYLKIQVDGCTDAGDEIIFHFVCITKVCWHYLVVKSGKKVCCIRRNMQRCAIGTPSEQWPWDFVSHDGLNELMARGLYCLGFDDPGVLSQLPPLTAHERLELHLSMPREFWPQKWLDEEKAGKPETL